MKDYKITETEAKFADIIWEKEPVPSSDLVKICAEVFRWKKSTTYTVLKNLCEKGIFQNENAMVTAKLKKDEFYGLQSREYVEEVFSGSLPLFLTAFCKGRKLSAAEAEEMRKFIDEYQE